MSEEHLSVEQIRCLVQFKVTRKQAIPLLVHLASCMQCRQEIGLQEILEGPDFLSRTQLDRTYSPAKALSTGDDFRQVIESIAEEDDAAEGYLREIVAAPRRQRILVVRNRKRFHTLGLVRRLLVEARAKFRVHGGAAEEFARLALVVIEELDRHRYPGELIDQRAVLARGYVANALRAQCRYPEAKEELAQAWEILNSLPWPAELERAWLLRFRASLKMDLHQFSAARKAALEARSLFLRTGQERDALWMIVVEALALEEAGEPEVALGLLEERHTEMTEANLGLSEFFAYESQRCLLLARTGEFLKAKALLPGLQQLDARHGEWNFSARLQWIQAMVHQGLDQGVRARECLKSALSQFVSHGHWLDGALVTLDLAQLCLRQQRTQEARALAKVVAPVFEAHGQVNEALAAVWLFLRAAQNEAASFKLLEEARSAVRKQQRAGSEQPP